jgi:chromate transport protein ChrA
MEFLTFSLVFAAAWLIWRRPEKERLAAGLLVVSIVLMVFLFSLGTRTSLLPGLNY